MTLIHRWPLEKDAKDVIGTAHLTNHGNTLFKDGGASFESYAQYLDVSDHTFDCSGDFTWAVFIKPYGAINKYYQDIVYLVNPSDSYNYSSINFHSTNGGGGANPLIECIQSYRANSSSTMNQYLNNSGDMSKYNINKWNLLCMVQTGSATEYWVNGKFVGSGANQITGASLTGVLTIGRLQGGTTQDFFNGGIKDLREYDVALTPAEMLKLYNSVSIPCHSMGTRRKQLLLPNSLMR